jgi:hypothetical protein
LGPFDKNFLGYIGSSHYGSRDEGKCPRIRIFKDCFQGNGIHFMIQYFVFILFRSYDQSVLGVRSGFMVARFCVMVKAA